MYWRIFPKSFMFCLITSSRFLSFFVVFGKSGDKIFLRTFVPAPVDFSSASVRCICSSNRYISVSDIGSEGMSLSFPFTYFSSCF